MRGHGLVGTLRWWNLRGLWGLFWVYRWYLYLLNGIVSKSRQQTIPGLRGMGGGGLGVGSIGLAGSSG